MLIPNKEMNITMATRLVPNALVVMATLTSLVQTLVEKLMNYVFEKVLGVAS